MVEEVLDTNLDTIISVLENIERDNLISDPSIREWIENITKPEFQLVDCLVKLFLDSLTDTTTIGNILKVLRKFLFYQKEVVRPQLTNNTTFPKAISDYIIKVDKPNISGDAFFLIADIFSLENFQDVTNETFVKALFNGLDVITDEDNFNSIVKILTDINNNPMLSQIFLKVYHGHDNNRILNESLYRILNSEVNEDVMCKILKCLTNIMDYENICIFYSSDIESFIDLTMMKLGTTCSTELRIYLLGLLERIMRYDDYFKQMYKCSMISELMENYLDSSKINSECKEICQQVLNNIKKHDDN